MTLLRLTFASLLLTSGLAHAEWSPRWTVAEGWTLTPSASWQYQALHAEAGEESVPSDYGFRRQRVALTLNAPGGQSVKLDYDLTAGTWADAFLRLPLSESQAIRLGQIKTPIGLETLTSHRSINSFERASTSVLLPSRRLGAEWAMHGKTRSLTLAAIGDNLDDQALGHGLFARATQQLGSDPDGQRWHLGLGAGVEWPDGSVRFRGRPDVSGLPVVLADSGEFADLDQILRLGLEAAWDRGPWTLQSEYVRLHGTRDAGDIDGEAAYLSASWRVTGEARGYGGGVFEAIEPSRPAGALELVARLSYLDVDTRTDTSQSGHSVSVGANWYLNTHWRIAAQVAGSPDDTVGRLYGLRLHLLF